MSEPVFFHVDMDAFFASVEQRDRPELAGRPVIVGAAPGHRGVVSACSYEARKFGVHSAMPISEAFRLCPQGVFLPVRMMRYHEVSSRIMELFESFSPAVQQMSVDEAFLDMTGTTRLFGEPIAAGRRLKEEVRRLESLAISVGIAPNRYLAKLASACSKPDGLIQVPTGGEQAFLDRLRLKDLWGVGKKTLERLEELGIDTVPDLRDQPRESLRRNFGQAGAEYLYGVCRGVDPGFFSGPPKSHSVSAETTFEHDVTDADTLERTLLDLSQSVMFRLFRSGDRSSTASIKLRLWDFRTTSAQTTLRHTIRSAEELHRTAVGLLRKRWDGATAVRLIGVGLDRVDHDSGERQPELFTDEEDRVHRVEKAVIAIEERYGTRPLRKASLLKRVPGRRDDAPGESHPEGSSSESPPTKN